MNNFSGQYTFKSKEFKEYFAADNLLNFKDYKPEILNNLSED